MRSIYGLTCSTEDSQCFKRDLLDVMNSFMGFYGNQYLLMDIFNYAFTSDKF